MKYLVFNPLVCLFLLIGCKSIKLPETKTVVNENKRDSLIIDDAETSSFIKAKLNGKELELLFDTGASRSTLKGIELIGGEEALTKNNHVKDQEIGTASGSVETILYSADSLKLNAVFHKNYTCFLFKIPQMNFNCNSDVLRLNSKGVLGMNVFSDTEKALVIDYKEQYLELSNPEILNLKGYNEIKAEFDDNNTILVETTIAGKKYDLLLDSGADHFVLLNKNPFKIEDQKVDMKSVLMLANGLKSFNATVFKNQDFQLSGLNIDKNIITVNENIDMNILGFKFMKNYNWLIDFKNEKLYAKKIAEYDIDTYFEKINSVKHVALAVNNQLMVVYSVTDDYAIGSKIKRVNGEKVDDQNICELQELLIDHKDNWEDINIEMY